MSQLTEKGEEKHFVVRQNVLSFDEEEPSVHRQWCAPIWLALPFFWGLLNPALHVKEIREYWVREGS